MGICSYACSSRIVLLVISIQMYFSTFSFHLFFSLFFFFLNLILVALDML